MARREKLPRSSWSLGGVNRDGTSVMLLNGFNSKSPILVFCHLTGMDRCFVLFGLTPRVPKSTADYLAYAQTDGEVFFFLSGRESLGESRGCCREILTTNIVRD